MSSSAELSIAQDFSPFPGGRTRSDGPFNGVLFRDDILRPLLEANDEVTLILDGVAGLPSSFWEEVIGGLIRLGALRAEDIGNRLRIRTSQPELQVYIPMAFKYAKDVSINTPQ